MPRVNKQVDLQSLSAVPIQTFNQFAFATERNVFFASHHDNFYQSEGFPTKTCQNTKLK